MAGTGETPEGSPLSPDDINNRLDEIAAELAAEARFKEPSAAERARAAAARQAQARKAQARKAADGNLLRRWGAGLKAAGLRRPVRSARSPAAERRRPAARQARRAAGWPAPDRGYATASGRHAHRSLIALLTVVAALFAASVGLHVLLHPSSSGTPETQPASATPTLSPLFTNTDPFANSPAQDYADGQAGIVLPVAGPVGEFTTAQVASAYQSVRQFLVAAELNVPTLEGGPPAAFAALLIPRQRSWFDANLERTGLTKQGVAQTTRGWVTSFFPGSVDFVGTVIKVNGGPMTAAVFDDHGTKVLRVIANYVFVYPVEQPPAPADRARVTTHVEMTVYFARWTDPGGPLQPWVADVNVSHAGALCGESDGYVHPQFSQPGKVAPSGLANPYKLGAPIKPGTCQASTGT